MNIQIHTNKDTVSAYVHDLDRYVFDVMPGEEEELPGEEDNDSFWVKRNGSVTLFCYQAPIVAAVS